MLKFNTFLGAMQLIYHATSIMSTANPLEAFRIFTYIILHEIVILFTKADHIQLIQNNNKTQAQYSYKITLKTGF